MEAKINLIGIFVSILFLSCSIPKTSYCQEKSTPIQNQWNIGLRDTIIKEYVGNSFVAYHFQGDTVYNIEWGNKTIKNISNQKFEVQGNGVLKILGTSENCILLSQGCGTSCSYYVILPLKINAVEKNYYFTLSYDLSNNLVAYIPNNNDGIVIRVENYLTGQVMDIKETNVCQASSMSDCIDSIYFYKSSLVLKWQGAKWGDNHQDLQERVIPIVFK